MKEKLFSRGLSLSAELEGESTWESSALTVEVVAATTTGLKTETTAAPATTKERLENGVGVEFWKIQVKIDS